MALEARRWSGLDVAPALDLADRLDAVVEAGFDGIELWERHLLDATPPEQERILDHECPVVVFNTYANLGPGDAERRSRVAEWVAATGAEAVKFNFGLDPGVADAEVAAVVAWANELPEGVRLVCECHEGTIAETPARAAALLAACGDVGRVDALVHTHARPDGLEAWIGALGERLVHVHVNHLDLSTLTAPPLADVDELAWRVDRLVDGPSPSTWTIEFVSGLNTADDQPGLLLHQAAADRTTLERLLR